MKSLLIFSPQFLPIMPFAGLAYMTGALRGRGLDVDQKDLNVEFYDYLLTSRFIEELHNIVRGRLAENLDRNEYIQLTHVYLRLKYLEQVVEIAKSNLRTYETYGDATKFSWSLRVIYDTLNSISSVYPTLRIDLSSLSLSSNGNSNEIAEFINGDSLIAVFLRRRIELYIRECQPDIVGLSVGDGAELPLAIASFIKSNFPQITVVVGGPGITVLGQNFQQNPEFFQLFDVLVLHDGELAYAKLVEALKANRGFEDVPNIMYVRGDEVVRNSIQVPDLTDVTPPVFDGLDLRLYLSPKTIFPVQIGRGCYWNRCTFCDRPATLTVCSGHAYRRKNIGQVLDEIRKLCNEYHAEYFYFTDEAIPPDYLNDLSVAISRHKLDIRWMGLIRFDKKFTESIIRNIKNSGCVKLGAGLESACNRILKLMKKGIKVERIQSMVDWFNRHGIPLHVWLMVGFPSETKEEALESQRFIESNLHKLDIPGFSVQFTSFMLDINSFVSRHLREYGVTQVTNPACKLGHYYEDFKTESSTSTRESRELARTMMKRTMLGLRYPELTDENFITTYLWGMFHSGQRVMRSADVPSPYMILRDNVILNTDVICGKGVPADREYWLYDHSDGAVVSLDESAFESMRNMDSYSSKKSSAFECRSTQFDSSNVSR